MLPEVLWLPEAKQNGYGDDRGDGRDNIDEPRPVEIRDEKLRNGEREPGGQCRGPDLPHAAETGHSPNDPERYNEREKRKLASDHLRERDFADAGRFAERDDRCAECAEGDWRRIGDEREAGRGERAKAELHEDGCRHSDRRAEAGGAFEECAERKRDQDDLDARVGRKPREALAQDREVALLDGELVEENQVKDNPANGKETVSRAENGSG